MPRIVYFIYTNGGIQGGHKIILRHVETLRDLGFNAVCYLGLNSKPPEWLDHRAPMIYGQPVEPADIIVLPDDAKDAIRACAQNEMKVVIISQNLYYFSFASFASLDRYPEDRFPSFMAVGPRLRSSLKKIYPSATVDLVPCFADEQIFRPAELKTNAIAYAPRKRRIEAGSIKNLFQKLHPRHADLPWSAIEQMTERQAAKTLSAASLFLSLNRLEGVGMTTLEAMASGCLCAGFTGVGGEDYATAENGFWAPNEDCEAAADGLAQAADILQTGGPALKARLEAGYETARQWSYAAFRTALEETWMRLAPDARVSAAPLDA